MAVNVLRRKELYKIMPVGLVTTHKWLVENNLSRNAIDNLEKQSGGLSPVVSFVPFGCSSPPIAIGGHSTATSQHKKIRQS